MNDDERKGRDMTQGALIAICSFFSIIIFFIFIAWIISNTFNLGIDNSDINGWKRSGLKIYTDNLTGVQYLETRNGLTPRLNRDGQLVIIENE